LAKAEYIGVDGVARKVKSHYLGVDSVARKVKSGHVGVSGVARQFFAGVSSVLNECTWEQIREVSDAGQGENYWSVGDTKTIIIDGDVGVSTFTNLSVDAFILGFNHNSSLEGSNRIHFKIGKINGVQIALVDGYYGTIPDMPSGGMAKPFRMNEDSTNTSGWAGSDMRRYLLGNNGTPLNPPGYSLMKALPEDLRAVMKSVIKYSDNTGSWVSNSSDTVTSTTDYLFLLSEFEFHGVRTYANKVEQNYQAQYDYYKAGNSKIHYRHNATDSKADSWCRSVAFLPSTANTSFCRVDNYGNAGENQADVSYGVAPCFVA